MKLIKLIIFSKYLSTSFFIIFMLFNSQAYGQSVLNCDVVVTSLESRHVPLLGFEGTKTITIVVTIYQDNRVQISGMNHIDAIYPAKRVTSDGIEFSGLLTPADLTVKKYYGNKVISGFLNRYNGAFDIFTPLDNMGFITFSGKGLCTKANKLF